MSIRARTSGFTLLELTVVVGIIGLLVALLFPVLALVRGSARVTVCMSNLRQVGTVQQAFATDHKEQLPRNRIEVMGIAPAVKSHKTWRAFLVDGDYLPGDTATLGELVGDPLRAQGQGSTGHPEAGQVWVCPSAADAPLREALDGQSECTGDVASNYAYNGEIAWQTYPLDSSRRGEIDLIEILRPSATLVMMETRAWWPDLRLKSIQGRGRHPAADRDGGGYFSYWHHDATGNWAFYDGSVRPMKLRETFDPESLWHNSSPEDINPADVRLWMAEVYR